MLKLILTLGLLFAPLASQALFEVRAGFGSMTPDEDNYQGQNLDKLNGFNLDLIVEPPLITDLGFGIRYEKLNMDIGNGEAELDRVAALINYRFIDFITYLGLIGTVGVSNDFQIEYPAGVDSDFDPKLNFSIGLEGGVSLGLIQVGAELGQFFAEVENPGSPDLDLSGLYGKVLVGFGF